MTSKNATLVVDDTASASPRRSLLAAMNVTAKRDGPRASLSLPAAQHFAVELALRVETPTATSFEPLMIDSPVSNNFQIGLPFEKGAMAAYHYWGVPWHWSESFAPCHPRSG